MNPKIKYVIERGGPLLFSLCLPIAMFTSGIDIVMRLFIGLTLLGLVMMVFHSDRTLRFASVILIASAILLGPIRENEDPMIEVMVIPVFISLIVLYVRSISVATRQWAQDNAKKQE